MNLLEKFGLTPVIGTFGAFFTISLSEINEYIAIAIGICTLVYTAMKCVDLYKQIKK